MTSLRFIASHTTTAINDVEAAADVVRSPPDDFLFIQYPLFVTLPVHYDIRSGTWKCMSCNNQSFMSRGALDAHLAFSDAHNYCFRCERDFSTPEARRHHWIGHPAHHYCVLCHEYFDNIDELEEHGVEEHLLCVGCDVFQRSQKDLEIHPKKKHFYCAPCKTLFKTRTGLVQHDIASHAYCVQCDRFLPSNAARLQHRMHSPSHHFCEDCEQDFDDDEDLTKHKETVHNWCDMCNTNIAASLDLGQHRVDVHHYCIRCPRYFQSADNLRQHLKSAKHTLKSLICPMYGCSAGFVSLSALIAHVESGGCPSRVTRRDVDRLALRLDVNGIITDRKDNNRPEVQNNNMYTLDNRNHPKQVINYADQRAYNGASYQCFLCPETFRALPHLNAHLASSKHIPGANVYICPCPPHWCETKFGSLSALMRHIEDEKCAVRRLGYVEKAIREIVERFSSL
jgi:hypothetical protein